MKILLVYPRYPATFWSFRYAMKFIDRKASFPPLGLLTVAAMLPGTWDKRLIDMNVHSITATDLNWADYVFISAMSIQRPSALEVIDQCLHLGVKTVGGGPLFTSCHEDFPDVDHLVLGEGEITLPLISTTSRACHQRPSLPGIKEFSPRFMPPGSSTSG